MVDGITTEMGAWDGKDEGFVEPRPTKIVFKQITSYTDPLYRPQGELDALASKVDNQPVSEFAWLHRYVRLREKGGRTIAVATSVDKDKKQVTLRYVGTVENREKGEDKDTVTVAVNTNDTTLRGHDMVLKKDNYVELAPYNDRPKPRTFEQIEKGQVVLFEPVHSRRTPDGIAMIMWQDGDLLTFPDEIDPLNPFPNSSSEANTPLDTSDL